VAVEVIVIAFPAQAAVPTWDARGTTDPAAVESALHRAAERVGRVEAAPLTQIIKLPKRESPGISAAAFVIVIGKKLESFELTLDAISS
jgi:hypothetical protein